MSITVITDPDTGEAFADPDHQPPAVTYATALRTLLDAERRRRHLTYNDLGRLTGVDTARVKAWLTGAPMPIEAVDRLCRAMRVRLVDPAVY
jgi:YD repeat-containing protein